MSETVITIRRGMNVGYHDSKIKLFSTTLLSQFEKKKKSSIFVMRLILTVSRRLLFVSKRKKTRLNMGCIVVIEVDDW